MKFMGIPGTLPFSLSQAWAVRARAGALKYIDSRRITTSFCRTIGVPDSLHALWKAILSRSSHWIWWPCWITWLYGRYTWWDPRPEELSRR